MAKLRKTQKLIGMALTFSLIIGIISSLIVPANARTVTISRTIGANASFTDTRLTYMEVGDVVSYSGTFTQGRQVSFLIMDSYGTVWGHAGNTSSNGTINCATSIPRNGTYRIHITNHSNSSATVNVTFTYTDNGAAPPSACCPSFNGAINYDLANFKIAVLHTAHTVLTLDVYAAVRDAFRGWNGLPGIGTHRLGITDVSVNPSASYSDHIFAMPGGFSGQIHEQPSGEVLPYNMNGQLDKTANADWDYILIIMNSSTSFWVQYGNLARQKELASATFIHEVGHALKLQHHRSGGNPFGGGAPPIAGHTEDAGGDWYPLSVMNPYASISSPGTTNTDITSLRNKWRW
ncbi:MAG: hypothetical protein FWH07_04750 [Oscillospiraceae bacterium]|nr:hypothetical protein [Oscillospiraceae bacterium]